MKFFQQLAKTTAVNFVIFVLVGKGLMSCKKEKFESVPDSGFSFSFICDPNIPRTLTTDYGPIEVPTGLLLIDQSDTVSNNYYYSFHAIIYHKYSNTTYNTDISLPYRLVLDFFPTSSLEVKTYSYTADIANAPNSLYGYLHTKDNYNVDYGWEITPAAFSYPDCNSTIVISNIYERKLADAVHKYADGSIDATMLGNDITNISGVTNLNNAMYESQLRLRLSFHGIEITRY